MIRLLVRASYPVNGKEGNGVVVQGSSPAESEVCLEGIPQFDSGDSHPISLNRSSVSIFKGQSVLKSESVLLFDPVFTFLKVFGRKPRESGEDV